MCSPPLTDLQTHTYAHTCIVDENPKLSTGKKKQLEYSLNAKSNVFVWVGLGALIKALPFKI